MNNNTNNGQVFANSDYTVNTESLVGKPSSYFQSNNTNTWNNIGGVGSGVNNSGFSTNANMGTNANFGTNPSYGTTPTLQNKTSTPWNYNATQPQNNIQQQLRMPAGTQQQITMPSYELQQKMQQPSTWDKVKNVANNFAGGTEAFSVGYATGATLGNFDEGMGTATAALTGNRNNYTMGRDATRQLQNDLQKQHPIAYGVGEFTGAMMTPMHLAKGENFKQKAFNALTDTLNASAGYAKNWKDFGTNLAVNGIANNVGLIADKIPLGRAAESINSAIEGKYGEDIDDEK